MLNADDVLLTTAQAADKIKEIVGHCSDANIRRHANSGRLRVACWVGVPRKRLFAEADVVRLAAELAERAH